MVIVFRDELGVCELIVDGDSIDFDDGYVWYDIGDKTYKIRVDQIIRIYTT